MRIKKVFWNTSTSLIYQIVSIVSGLIVPRLILEYYGSEFNGIVSSAVQFMGAIGILTVGLTGAARVSLYKSLAENDTFMTNNVMSAITRYMNKVALALAVYTVILAGIFPYISTTTLPAITVAFVVLSVGVGKFIEQLLGIPYRILLQADQRNYIENVLTTIGCIIYTAVSVLMITHCYSIISVKLMSAFVSLIIMLGIYFYTKSHYRLKKIKNYDKNVLSQRKDAAVHSIANMVHQNSDLIILTLSGDIKLVSVYTVYYFVVGQIKRILESFTGGLEAAFGNMWVKNELVNIKDRFRLYELFIFSFVIIIFSCVVVLILPFVRLYTKNVTDVEYVRPILAYLIVVVESVYCIRQPYVTLVFATGRYKETKNIAVIEALSNVTVSLLLVRKFGIVGVMIGTLCANLIRTIYYIYYTSSQIIERNIWEVVYKVVWTIFTLFAVVFIEMWSIEIIGEITDWGKWIFAGCLNFSISLIMTTISGSLFFKKEFGDFRKIIDVIFHKKIK